MKKIKFKDLQKVCKYKETLDFCYRGCGCNVSNCYFVEDIKEMEQIIDKLNICIKEIAK